jgi:predicted SnoaL-like aldol condensation-catalyzing enzyme
MAKSKIHKDYKREAVQFLKLIVSGDIERAYQEYVDSNGKHHNCYFPAGFAALKKAMLDNHRKFPSKRIDVRNVVQEGSVVVVHSHLIPGEGEHGMVTVHIFRFEGEKIVEFWDCGQQIPEEMPNEDGAF